jgi:hypothetical protein
LLLNLKGNSTVNTQDREREKHYESKHKKNKNKKQQLLLSPSLSLCALLLTTGSTTKLSQMLSYCLELPSTTKIEDHYIGTCSKRMKSSHFLFMYDSFGEDFIYFFFCCKNCCSSQQAAS